MRLKVRQKGNAFSLFLLSAFLLLATEAVKDLKFYKILGISEDADEQTIKKAYRKAAM